MLLIAVILAAVEPAAAQRPVPQPLAAGTSALGGTVTDALTKAPVAGCEVLASKASAGRSSAVTTGADGRYEFAGIEDGIYFLMIRCRSHMGTCVQPGEPGGKPCGNVTLFKDQQRSDLNFRVVPGARMRGRVMDAAGRPVAKAMVRLGGPFIDRPIFSIIAAATKSDGTFELSNLPDGKWRVEVEVPTSPDAPRPPIIYHPGVFSWDDAGLVELFPGRITENISITIPRILDRTLTVRMPPPDATIPSVTVSLIRPSPLMMRRLDLDAEGRATVRGLLEGRYFVTATGRSEQHLWVDYQPVDFIGASIDVSLHLQPAGRIRGRIVTNGVGWPQLGGATVGAVWVDEDVTLNPLTPEEALVAADGTFEIDGLFGRRRLQLIRFDPDWRIESILQGRSDVTTAGVDVAPNSVAEITIVVGRR